MCGCRWKVGLCNKKTKIYRTIKGLIILFNKLQFSIRCNQAFKPLHTSTSNIYLNLSLNLNGLVTCIIPIRLYHPDTPHDSRRTLSRILYPFTTSGPGLRTCQAWGSLVYLPGGLCHFSQCPDVYTWRSWHPHKGEVLVTSSKTFIHIATKGCSSVVHPTPGRVDDLQEG